MKKLSVEKIETTEAGASWACIGGWIAVGAVTAVAVVAVVGTGGVAAAAGAAIGSNAAAYIYAGGVFAVVDNC